MDFFHLKSLRREVLIGNNHFFFYIELGYGSFYFFLEKKTILFIHLGNILVGNFDT